jgi:hypothetical protein
MQEALILQEDQRLRTWILPILETLLPDVRYTHSGADRKFLDTGGLCVSLATGAWYWHADGAGGYSAIPLLMKPRLLNCSRAEAVKWGKAWLTNHPGIGPSAAADSDGDLLGAAADAARVTAEEILRRAVPAAGTRGEQYLTGRSLPPPYPDWILFCEDVRCGEDGLVVLLHAHETTVGIQVTYLDATARKSLIEPVRRTYFIDHERGPAGVFEYVPDTRDAALSELICEGTEDMLSLAKAFPKHRVTGVPGVHGITKLAVAKGESFVICRDGDPPDHPASKSLIRGIDHLLLEGAAQVLVTAPAEGTDNNDVLQSGGIQALQELVAATTPAELSMDGEIIRLSRLPPREYECERKKIKETGAYRVGFLDREVKKERALRAEAETPASPSLVRHEPDPWPDEVRLKDVLDPTSAPGEKIKS